MISLANVCSIQCPAVEPISPEALERLRRSAAMGGLPRDACEELLGEIRRLRSQLSDVDEDLAKAERILQRARARLAVGRRLRNW